MGRLMKSTGLPPPQSQRRAARAKDSRFTVNVLIPTILKGDPRARNGIEHVQLILPEDLTGAGKALDDEGTKLKPKGKTSKKGRKGKRDISSTEDEDRLLPKDLEEKSKITKPSRRKNTTSPQQPLILAPSSRQADAPTKPLRTRVMVHDTLAAAYHLHTTLPKAKHASSSSSEAICVLNMASPLRPGGGVLTGATSQEETLCRRTTLLSSLKEEFYRLPEVGAIYTPSVLVFKGPDLKDLTKKDRYHVSVISAAAIRFPDTVVSNPKRKAKLGDIYSSKASKDNAVSDTKSFCKDADDASNHDAAAEGDETTNHSDTASIASSSFSNLPSISTVYEYANPKDRALTLKKMIHVLSVIISRGHTSAVLGAWGCGAYGNPTEEVARLWQSALNTLSLKRESLREVVFAIDKPHIARCFASAWDGDIEVIDCKASESVQREGVINGESPVELLRLRIKELDGKIGDLETQMEESRFPERIKGVLDVLKRERRGLSLDVNEQIVSDGADTEEDGDQEVDGAGSKEDDERAWSAGD